MQRKHYLGGCAETNVVLAHTSYRLPRAHRYSDARRGHIQLVGGHTRRREPEQRRLLISPQGGACQEFPVMCGVHNVNTTLDGNLLSCALLRRFWAYLFVIWHLSNRPQCSVIPAHLVQGFPEIARIRKRKVMGEACNHNSEPIFLNSLVVCSWVVVVGL